MMSIMLWCCTIVFTPEQCADYYQRATPRGDPLQREAQEAMHQTILTKWLFLGGSEGKVELTDVVHAFIRDCIAAPRS